MILNLVLSGLALTAQAPATAETDAATHAAHTSVPSLYVPMV